jgi:glucose/mannose transport system substrate-binding protein
VIKKTFGILLSGAVMLAASQARAQTVDVVHHWTSASETAAIHVFADAFKKRGGTWIDEPDASPADSIAVATSRIAGGQAPALVLMNPNSAMRDMADAGLLRNFNDLSTQNNWEATQPSIFWKMYNYKGNLVSLPTGIHGTNWVWYSKPIFDELGLSEPKTYDEVFADADKIKQSNRIAVAVGGEPWQEAELLFIVLSSLSGPDLWNKLIVDRDPAALQDPILKQAFDVFRKFSTYADPASPGRSWNDTANLVVTGKAGMMFLGDYVKGEFLSANKHLGKDFGCFLAPAKEPIYPAMADVFVFPVTKDPIRIAGQTLMAQTLMDPKVASDFCSFKGCVPSRLDVDASKLDHCEQIGVNLLSQPNVPVMNQYDALPGDMNGRLIDLATQFWTDPTMTSDAAVKAFGEILQAK